MHRWLLAVLAIGFGASASPAQDQAELKARLEKKLAEDWLKDGGWTTDYDAARAAARESGKVIFAYFSRSYAP